MKRVKERLSIWPVAVVAILLSLVINECRAQTKDGDAVLLKEVVIDSLSNTKNDLKDKCREWIGKTFISGKDVITSDTEALIVGRYYKEVHSSTGLSFEHRITIDVKDNKLRVRIWAIRSSNGYAAIDYFFPIGIDIRKVHKKWLDQLMDDANQTVLSITLHMKNKNTDDW